MKKVLLLFIILGFSCSKSSGLEQLNPKLIQRIQYFNSNIEEMFYYNDDNLLTLIKTTKAPYTNRMREINYNYNASNQLTSISNYNYHNNDTYLYDYYLNGNLKTITIDYENPNGIDKVYNLEYESDLIIVNKGDLAEFRIYLNSEKTIVSTTRRHNYSGVVSKRHELTYNGQNLTQQKNTSSHDPRSYKTYSFGFDSKVNPFSVFDFKLPNNLSLKQIQELIAYSNTSTKYASKDEYFYFGYLGENNITSVEIENNASTTKYSENRSFTYNYDTDNYPISIEIEEANTKSLIAINYY